MAKDAWRVEVRLSDSLDGKVGGWNQVAICDNRRTATVVADAIRNLMGMGLVKDNLLRLRIRRGRDLYAMTFMTDGGDM